MSESRLTTERFAIELSGIALGIWEAARLLADKSTQDEGQRKLQRLRSRVETFKHTPVLSDSLRVYFNREFNPDEYTLLLDRVSRESFTQLSPEIEKLVHTAQDYLNEPTREAAGFKGTL